MSVERFLAWTFLGVFAVIGIAACPYVVDALIAYLDRRK